MAKTKHVFLYRGTAFVSYGSDMLLPIEDHVRHCPGSWCNARLSSFFFHLATSPKHRVLIPSLMWIFDLKTTPSCTFTYHSQILTTGSTILSLHVSTYVCMPLILLFFASLKNHVFLIYAEFVCTVVTEPLRISGPHISKTRNPLTCTDKSIY